MLYILGHTCFKRFNKMDLQSSQIGTVVFFVDKKPKRNDFLFRQFVFAANRNVNKDFSLSLQPKISRGQRKLLVREAE